MKKSKSMKSASVRAASRLARITNPQNEPPGSVFMANELEPHGNPLEKGVHIVGAPLSRWRLVASLHCVRGEVRRAPGPAAGDGDTNFNLALTEPEQVDAINAKIDFVNQSAPGAAGGGAGFRHVAEGDANRLADGPIFLHCEVDATDLDTFKDDLAGMMIGDCYDICGQLVLDTAHAGGIYEIHPVQSIDKC